MEITKAISLDVSKSGVQETINLTQHDAGATKIEFSLTNGGSPVAINRATSTAMLYVDELDIMQNVTITDDNRLEYTVNSSATQRIGNFKAVLQFVNHGDFGTYFSPQFQIAVQEDMTEGSSVINSDPFSAVIQAREAAKGYLEEFEKKASGLVAKVEDAVMGLHIGETPDDEYYGKLHFHTGDRAGPWTDFEIVDATARENIKYAKIKEDGKLYIYYRQPDGSNYEVEVGSVGGSNIKNIAAGAGSRSLIGNNTVEITLDDGTKCVCEATWDDASAFGWNTKAYGKYSFAKGCHSRAVGNGSSAEGFKTTAGHLEDKEYTGHYSHAEGQETYAEADASHSEGQNTTSLGQASHAEGVHSKARGRGSHAEGANTDARGNFSHTEGEGTVATADCQHVEGKYNRGTEDEKDKAHILGGGWQGKDSEGKTTNYRRTIHDIDWQGNTRFSGSITLGMDAATGKGGEVLDKETLKRLKSGTGGSSELRQIQLYRGDGTPFEYLKGFIQGKLLTVVGIVYLTSNEDYGFTMHFPDGVIPSPDVASTTIVCAYWLQDMTGLIVFDGGGVYGYLDFATVPCLVFNTFYKDDMGTSPGADGKQVILNFTIPLE